MLPTVPPTESHLMVWPNTVIIFMLVLLYYVVSVCRYELDFAKLSRQEFFRELES